MHLRRGAVTISIRATALVNVHIVNNNWSTSIILDGAKK
jgi:hypothetical protein